MGWGLWGSRCWAVLRDAINLVWDKARHLQHCSIVSLDETEVASVLLQNDADINAQTSGGQTPLHLAATYSRDNSLLEMLLMEKRLDPNIVNCQNETALDLAKRSGRKAMLFELIEDSVNVRW